MSSESQWRARLVWRPWRWPSASAPDFHDRQLFATSAHDPVIFAAVALLRLAVGAQSAMAPAIRAARVDPVVALRTQ